MHSQLTHGVGLKVLAAQRQAAPRGQLDGQLARQERHPGRHRHSGAAVHGGWNGRLVSKALEALAAGGESMAEWVPSVV